MTESTTTGMFKEIYENMTESDIRRQEHAVMVYALVKAWDMSEDKANELVDRLEGIQK